VREITKIKRFFGSNMKSKALQLCYYFKGSIIFKGRNSRINPDFLKAVLDE
jgi:hypothetical protein